MSWNSCSKLNRGNIQSKSRWEFLWGAGSVWMHMTRIHGKRESVYIRVHVIGGGGAVEIGGGEASYVRRKRWFWQQWRPPVQLQICLQSTSSPLPPISKSPQGQCWLFHMLKYPLILQWGENTILCNVHNSLIKMLTRNQTQGHVVMESRNSYLEIFDWQLKCFLNTS